MRKILVFFVFLVIGIILFIWILNAVGWQEIKNAFLVFTGWHGTVIFGLTLLTMLIGNWKWKEILKGEGVNIPFFSLWRLYLASFSIRYLAPVILIGSELFQGYALKARNLVAFPKGMASVIIDRILEWTANLVVIFFGVLFFLLIIGLPPAKLLIIFGGVFFFFVGGMGYFYLKIFKRESMAKAILRVLGLAKLNGANSILEIEAEIFNFFKIKKISMWKSFSLSFLRVGVMYFRAWLLILFLGKSVGAFPALSVLGFNYLAVMIPIPTALGSHEAIQTFAFNSLEWGLGAAAAFTMIIRGAELIIALAGAIILYRLGIDLLKNTLDKKINNFAPKN